MYKSQTINFDIDSTTDSETTNTTNTTNTTKNNKVKLIQERFSVSQAEAEAYLTNINNENASLTELNNIINIITNTNTQNKQIITEALKNAYYLQYINDMNKQNAIAYKQYLTYKNPKQNKYYQQYL